MARRSKKKGDLLEAACAIAALVGFVVGWQWPGKGLEKIYTGAVGAFIGPVLVLALSFWLTRKKKNPSYESSTSPSVESDPWPKDEVDQYPIWKETNKRAAEPSATGSISTTVWSLELLRAVEWHRLEMIAKGYFEALGIKAELTPFGADGGVDLHLYSKDSDKPRTLVQCKAWNAWTVGVKPIRELYGVMSARNVREGVFITSGTFTRDAKEFSEGKIDLVDGPDLLRKILDLPSEKSEALLRATTEGDYVTPTCPSCGIKMVERKSKTRRNRFWGCRNFPKCKQTLAGSDAANAAA